MKPEELKDGITVCHTKHNTMYFIFSSHMRMKAYDPERQEMVWMDAVVYVPLYENEYDCFTREKNSFLEEFEVVDS